MKKLFAILAILALPVMAQAAEVKLAWDYDGPADHTFRLYQGETSGQYDVTKDFTAKEGVMDGLEPGKTYFFAATTRTQQGLEGDKSNVTQSDVSAEPCRCSFLHRSLAGQPDRAFH